MRSSTTQITAFSIILLLVSPLPSIADTSSEKTSDNSEFLQLLCSKLDLNENQCFKLSKTSSFLGYAAIAAAVGTVGIPALLTSMGFGTTGIIAGSWAASYQSAYGVGTVFSWLQSVSMTGTAAFAVTKAGLAVAAIKSYFGSDSKRSTKDKEEH